MAGVIGKIGGFAKKIGEKAYERGALKQGIDAFKSWKSKKAEKAKPAAGMTSQPAAKSIGSFKTGIDTNLKIPKISSFGRDENPFSSGM